MKRRIEWIEKTEDGVRRTVRVAFPGSGKIKWQFKCSGSAAWDYDTPPTAEDWQALEETVDRLYHRRRAAYKDLELVRTMRKKHG